MMCLQSYKPWQSKPRQYQTDVEQPRHIPHVQKRNFTGPSADLNKLQCTLNAEKPAALAGSGDVVKKTLLRLPARRSPVQS
jgi:hypothetical protein